jgi:Nickel responsive protein SCO4226-like
MRTNPEQGTLSSNRPPAISQKSCGVSNHLGPQIQWIESYLTDDKMYCIDRHRMRKWCVNMRARADSQPIGSQKSEL